MSGDTTPLIPQLRYDSSDDELRGSSPLIKHKPSSTSLKRSLADFDAVPLNSLDKDINKEQHHGFDLAASFIHMETRKLKRATGGKVSSIIQYHLKFNNNHNNIIIIINYSSYNDFSLPTLHRFTRDTMASG
jgi:hypothetical protein